MRRRYYRRSEDMGGGASVWLVSFTDTIALMLTFFVLQYAMAYPKEEVWQGFTENMQTNFNRYYGGPLNRGDQDTISVGRVKYNDALDLGYLKTVLTTLLEKEEGLSTVSMSQQNNSISLSLPGDMMFEAGQADVTQEGAGALKAIAMTLRRIRNRIEIVGHSAPEEQTNAARAGGWNLSLERAAAVAGILEVAGYDRQVIIRGEGDGRYQALNGNDLSQGQRLALSHRIDIVIMEDDGKQVTVFDINAP